MDEEVREMIAEHIILMNVVVQGERIVSHKTFHSRRVPDCVDVTDIVDALVVDDVPEIIQMKRTIETVGIDNNAHDTDENQGRDS